MKWKFTLVRMLCFSVLLLFAAMSYSQSTTSDEALKAKIAKNMAQTGIPAAYLQDAQIASSYTDSKTGIEHIYIQQAYKGIEVYNQIISLAFKDNKLLYSAGTFIKGIENQVSNPSPSITAQDAVMKAANHLHLVAFLKDLIPTTNSLGTDNKVSFSPAGIAKREIETKLYWTADSLGKLHLTWNVSIDVINKPDWWNVRIDAFSGEVVQKNNWTTYEKENRTTAANDNKAISSVAVNNYKFLPPPSSVNSASYYVIPYPAENRNVTNFTSVTNPWESAGTNNNATTYGWQYDGAASYTITRGNNVYAYDDSANKNKPGRPAMSVTPLPNLTFKAQPDFTKQPYDSINRTAAVTNLFYWNNEMHDVMYQYGFTEATGNFQANNLLRGGLGNDYVYAEAQDGSGVSNANFTYAPDGTNGRMQMYLFPTGPTLTIKAPSSIAGQYESTESNFSINNQLYKIGPVSGTVAYYSTTDSLGCSPLPQGNTSLNGKIALLYRGGCNFTQKVKDAQNAGAIAVIVIYTSDTLVIMSGSDNSITIPAVLVTKTDGAKFLQSIRNGNTVTATMSAIEPPNLALDGALDNSIITHEYTHGVSTRLTGGPANVGCLQNAEQGGEGWSDYVALMMTTNWATTQLTDGTKARPIGTYVLGESINGAGIRRYPYSTDMSINPLTYASMALSTEVHDIGEIWCVTLWDMTWNIIQQEGKIEGNLYNSASTGGNAIALNLVLEGMKLQPCGPGYLDARNAILAADSILYGYRHKCAIWNAFARRGMGVSAIQGSANNASDQVAAYNAPGAVLSKTTDLVITNGQFTESLTATCGCNVPAANYSIRDTIPKGLQYVSSTGGSVTDSVVSFPVKFTSPLQSQSFSVTLAVNSAGCSIDSVVYDDRDSHTKGGFTSTTFNGSKSWVVSATKSYSPTHSWYATDADSLTQFVLTSAAFTPKGVSTLSFWHYVNTQYGFDGGLVELQVNNTSWRDASPYFIKNGYNAVIAKTNGSLPAVYGFTGTPFSTFSQSLINLSSFSDSSVKVRFRMRSDSLIRVDGWYIDNISVANGCGAFSKIGLYDTVNNISQSFSIPVYNTSSVLPLSLFSFTATAQGTSAILKWQTASEVNTREFSVEVSKDGISYAAIGTVSAKGESSNSYTLNDANPYSGLNYYRIKMINDDGSFTYSPVRSLLFTGKGFIVVKPNPAVNSTTVYFDKDVKLVYITLSDMQGKLLKQVSAKNMSGSYTFNTSSLPAGTYIIKAFPQTGAPVAIKLVVNH